MTVCLLAKSDAVKAIVGHDMTPAHSQALRHLCNVLVQQQSAVQRFREQGFEVEERLKLLNKLWNERHSLDHQGSHVSSKVSEMVAVLARTKQKLKKLKSRLVRLHKSVDVAMEIHNEVKLVKNDVGPDNNEENRQMIDNYDNTLQNSCHVDSNDEHRSSEVTHLESQEEMFPCRVEARNSWSPRKVKVEFQIGDESETNNSEEEEEEDGEIRDAEDDELCSGQLEVKGVRMEIKKADQIELKNHSDSEINYQEEVTGEKENIVLISAESQVEEDTDVVSKEGDCCYSQYEESDCYSQDEEITWDTLQHDDVSTVMEHLEIGGHMITEVNKEFITLKCVVEDVIAKLIDERLRILDQHPEITTDHNDFTADMQQIIKTFQQLKVTDDIDEAIINNAEDACQLEGQGDKCNDVNNNVTEVQM